MNDPATVERIVRECWRLAHWRAGDHIRREGPNGDRAAVESDALLGLFQAARSYDPARGVALATHVRTNVDSKIIDGYRYRLGRAGGHNNDLSLDKLVHLGGLDPAFDAVERADLVVQVLALLDEVLTPHERGVMRELYVAGKSQKDVAAGRRVTPSAVSIVHRRAVGKLRRRLVYEDTEHHADKGNVRPVGSH